MSFSYHDNVSDDDYCFDYHEDTETTTINQQKPVVSGPTAKDATSIILSRMSNLQLVVNSLVEEGIFSAKRFPLLQQFQQSNKTLIISKDSYPARVFVF